jgi:multidrug efflux system outer membrane protein
MTTGSLLCLSCTVGPDYNKPDFYSDAVIKKELNLQESYTVSPKWYTQLRDSNLNMLIEKALQNNTDIATAKARLHQARAILKADSVQFLPMINADTGYNYEKNSKNIGTALDYQYYTAGFDASWELDLWGKGRRQDEADTAKVKAAEYTLKNMETTIIAEVAADYVNLLVGEEKLRIAKQNLALQKNIFATVSRKYTEGLTDNIAYKQAGYLVETTGSQIPSLENQISSYKNALATLIGVLPSEIKQNGQSPLFRYNYKYDEAMPYKLPADIIRKRPDVAAAEQNLIAQNALVGKYVAELYPNVNITALWGFAAKGGSHLFTPHSKTYSYKPILSLPLLDWNSLADNVKAQKYVKEEALQQYKQTVLNAVSELKNAMTAYLTEIAANRRYGKALNDMSEVVKQTQERYNSGITEFSELLTAEQNLLAAQDNYIDSKGRIFQNVIAYYKASGGGY